MRGCGLRSKEMSILDRPWGGPADEIVEVLIVGLGGVGSKGFVGGPIRQLTIGILATLTHGPDDALVSLR